MTKKHPQGSIFLCALVQKLASCPGTFGSPCTHTTQYENRNNIFDETYFFFLQIQTEESRRTLENLEKEMNNFYTKYPLSKKKDLEIGQTYAVRTVNGKWQR